MTIGSGTISDPYIIKFYSNSSPEPSHVKPGSWYRLQNETPMRYEDMKVDNPTASSNFSIFGSNDFGNCNPNGGQSDSIQQALNPSGPTTIYNNHDSIPIFGSLACVISLNGASKMSPTRVGAGCEYVFYNDTGNPISALRVGDENDSLFGNQWEIGSIAAGAYSEIYTVTNPGAGANGGDVMEPGADQVGGSSITFGTLTVSSSSVGMPTFDDKDA